MMMALEQLKLCNAILTMIRHFIALDSKNLSKHSLQV